MPSRSLRAWFVALAQRDARGVASLLQSARGDYRDVMFSVHRPRGGPSEAGARLQQAVPAPHPQGQVTSAATSRPTFTNRNVAAKAGTLPVVMLQSRAN